MRVDVVLNGANGDADVAADVDAEQLAGAGEPVDVPRFNAEPVGNLGHGEELGGTSLSFRLHGACTPPFDGRLRVKFGLTVRRRLI
jgi:hypothetical protein